jgi:hypothetical protein
MQEQDLRERNLTTAPGAVLVSGAGVVLLYSWRWMMLEHFSPNGCTKGASLQRGVLNGEHLSALIVIAHWIWLAKLLKSMLT